MFLQQSNYFRRFWCKFVKSWQKNYEEIEVYYIGYVTFKEITNCNNINSGNPLYLMIDEMIGQLEEKSGNKYSVLDDIHENKKVSKKYEEVWDRIKKEIETINGGKKILYEKVFQKIRFEVKDDLPMNKSIKLLLLTTIIRCIFSFSEDDKFYLQLFLDNTLYDV